MKLSSNKVALGAFLALVCIVAIAFCGSSCSCNSTKTVEGVIVEYDVTTGWNSTTTIVFEDGTKIIAARAYTGEPIKLGEEYRVVVNNHHIQSIEEI